MCIRDSYDLAPHDLSIVLHLTDSRPRWVQAMGLRYGFESAECLSYIHLEFDNGVVAHFHLSWISPVKLRRMIVAGSEKMAVYDDMNAGEKIKIFDKGMEPHSTGTDEINKALVNYRIGDMWAPQLETTEALTKAAQEFLEAIAAGAEPETNGTVGLRVVRILEAATRSMEHNGQLVELDLTENT